MNPDNEIPLEKQLEAACYASTVWYREKAMEILNPYGYPSDENDYNKYLPGYLSFKPEQLVDYLKQHSELRDLLWIDSGDKRYTPATFMTLRNGEYLVGMGETVNDRFIERNVQVFDTLEEAVADYVLYSLGLKRLSQK